MKKLLLLPFLFFALPLSALAVQVTVPSAPGLGYALVSTSTGNYIATTTDPFHVGSIYAESTGNHSVFLDSIDTPGVDFPAGGFIGDGSGGTTNILNPLGAIIVGGTPFTFQELAGGGTQCLHIDNNGLVTGTGSDCGSGGGGGNDHWATSTTNSSAIIPAGAIKVGIGTTSPWGILSVGTTTATNAALPLFTVASSTNLTLFQVNNNGQSFLDTNETIASTPAALTIDAGSIQSPLLINSNNTGATDLRMRNGSNNQIWDIDVNGTANAFGSQNFLIGNGSAPIMEFNPSGALTLFGYTGGGTQNLQVDNSGVVHAVAPTTQYWQQLNPFSATYAYMQPLNADRLVIDPSGIITDDTNSMLQVGGDGYVTGSFTASTMSANTATFNGGISAGSSGFTVDGSGNINTIGTLGAGGSTLSSLTVSGLGGGGTQCVEVDNSGAFSVTGLPCGGGGGGGSVTSVATNNGLTGGPITTSGILGLDLTSISNNALLTYSTASNRLVATGTQSLTAGNYIGTTTATSTLAGGFQTLALNITSTTASSTFANGINLAKGCFSIGGTCLTSGITTVSATYPITSSGGSNPTIAFSGLGTTSPWINGNLAYVVNGNTVTSVATSSGGCSGFISCSAFTVVGSGAPTITQTGVLPIVNGGTNSSVQTLGNIWYNGSAIVSTSSIYTSGSYIGTTTATSTLAGGLQTAALNVTSTTATSTFANGINLASGCYAVGGTCLNTANFWTSLGGNIYNNTGTNVGIGTTSPFSTLAVEPTTGGLGKTLFAVASTTNATIFSVSGTGEVMTSAAQPVVLSRFTTGVSSPYAVLAAGRYVYVANSANSTLETLDYSNPTSPVKIGSVTITSGAPVDLAISGRYVYVADESVGLDIVDVSNPAKPFLASTTSAGLSGAQSVTVSGRYAYVVSAVNNTIVTFDVSNPASPMEVSSVGTGLSLPQHIAVQGRYAYVTSYSNGQLVIFDISNPVAPVQVSSTGTGLQQPYGISVSGRYAYIGETGLNAIVTYDISNPNAPVEVNSLSGGSLNDPSVLTAQGRYLYVNSIVNGDVIVYDIANPASPLEVSHVNLGGTSIHGIAVSGHYGYVADESGSIVNLDLGGNDVSSENVGSLEAGNLQTRNDILDNGNLSVSGGVGVGTGGIISNGPISVGIASTTQTNPISAYFQGFVGLGTTTPPQTLTVQGGVSVYQSAASSTVYLDGALGGNVIMKDDDGSGACTEIYTKTGLVLGKVVSCPF